MQLMIANADGRVLNWGQRPWANEPDASTVTVLEWPTALPDSPSDYRLVSGALVLDALPLAPIVVEQAAAQTSLLAQVVAAYQRLSQIQQQAATLQAQMATLKAQAATVAGMTTAQATSVTTIKQMAAAIGTLADGQSGIAAAVSDEAGDIQFLARQIAAGLGVVVTGA